MDRESLSADRGVRVARGDRLAMHASLAQTDHRPWPLPDGEWKWRQSWLKLAFIHFRVAVTSLRPAIPSELAIQEFDGTGWVGLVPFKMAGVMRRGLPNVPGVSAFPELNLRTYVECEGKPGVWFFSLDAASWPIVLGGRHVYGLPYFHARMRHRQGEDGWCDFSSRRRGSPARFEGSFRPVGEVFTARAGTFEHWASERYCLYALRRGRLSRVDVHHAPWPLQSAEIRLAENGILAAAAIEPLDPRPVCHFSTGVDVVSYPPVDLRASRRGPMESRAG